MPDTAPEKSPKSPHAEREERILSFWKENAIFEKTLEKNKNSGKEFVFYEGPPTANGQPGIHHLEARAFKDALPRYKTMQGYYVRRKGGWDTHGLPVELQVEKELGLKSKKEIETYGIAAFNEKCKESVWKYVHEWEDFTDRMGYWVDLKDPYITYKADYIESLWSIFKTVDDKKLLYKDYKVVPWCPRCGTGLSSHELAQGYEEVKDLSVTVEFRVKGKSDTSLLAWTTTPWTLPGNVALAVNPKIMYVEIEKKDMGTGAPVRFILAKDLLGKIFPNDEYTVIKEILGKDLVGMEYESLYPFLKDSITGTEKEKMSNAYKVYAADFVTTTDGTGIVHTAVMYGQDDFELGTKVGLPKFHLVNEDGTFKQEAGFLAGKFVKGEGVDVDIIKDLAAKGVLFNKEKYTHTYPFCWRCKTPLIYFARDSWYIRMSSLRDELVKENGKINWEPDYIKEGRFGEWLTEVKDWAISRERYWGTPLPIWCCDTCQSRKVVGSVEEVTQKSKNEYSVMRHGEAENNTQGVMGSLVDGPYHLTEKGKEQVRETANSLKGKKFDLVVVSPFIRTRETFEILNSVLNIPADKVVMESRIGEWNTGEWNGKPIEDFMKAFPQGMYRFKNTPANGENYADVKKRAGQVLYELEAQHSGKNILFVTHEVAGWMLISAAQGLDREQTVELRGEEEFLRNAEIKKASMRIVPHNGEFELDLHKPFIDEVTLPCKCGGEMKRVKEVMDVWFDSGAMPFAQDHKVKQEGGGKKQEGEKSLIQKMLHPFDSTQKLSYPADFISEAIDQTRGWFYTLHAIGVLMGKGHAYKNVICLGHILDSKGKKMSKSIGNVINPWDSMDTFGADALRFWMYSVNQPGESKNFDEKTVDEGIKKVFNLTLNVVAFYKLYEKQGDRRSADRSDGASQQIADSKSQNILDKWILTRLNQLNTEVTSSLDKYKLLEPTRAIRDFVGDLSQWYLRRSRDRFKEDGADKDAALATTQYVIIELSKLLAPFTPFLAEHLYKEVGGLKESVHLEDWTEAGPVDQKLLSGMEAVRTLASKGLEARTVAKINVRQPLQSLNVRGEALEAGLVELIKDEVNVKEVSFGASIEKEVTLDTNITPALKEEGDVRELIRLVQDMRKEKGLSVGDKAVLVIGPDQEALVQKNAEQIKKVAGLSAIESGEKLELKV